MTYVITDACRGVKDSGCVEICPVDAIHPTPDESGFAEADQLYIDPDSCIDCGICVDECPVRAIYADSDLPADQTHFIELNAAWFEKKSAGG